MAAAVAVVEEMLLPSLLSLCAPDDDDDDEEEEEEEVNGGTIVRGRYNSMEAMRFEEQGKALLDGFFIVVFVSWSINDDDDDDTNYEYLRLLRVRDDGMEQRLWSITLPMIYSQQCYH